MNFTALLGLAFVCAMGAMSPGPSLAVVLRNTVSGGRRQGVLTGIGHGLGFGIYASIAVMGLSAILLANESVFSILQWSGVCILLWLSYNMLAYNPSDINDEHSIGDKKGFVEGFMIAFLNPKILVFLVAVFSQFLDPNMTNTDRMIMALLAGLIDTSWYVFVAVVLAGTPLIDKLRDNSVLVDRMIGVVLIFLALVLVYKSFF